MHLLASVVGISPITVSPFAPCSGVLTDHVLRLEYFTEMCKYVKSEVSDHPPIITPVGDIGFGENNVLPGYRTRKQNNMCKIINDLLKAVSG